MRTEALLSVEVSTMDTEVTILSEAERRVASLAVRGYTNRDIAAHLYLTVSTVEQHLTRTYRKLRVNRRQDLPTNLDRCHSTDLRCSRSHA